MEFTGNESTRGVGTSGLCDLGGGSLSESQLRELTIQTEGGYQSVEADRGFPGGSRVKNPPGNAGRRGFDPWMGTIPWRRQWHPTPVFLPEKSHGQRILVIYSPWSRKDQGTTTSLHDIPDRNE